MGYPFNFQPHNLFGQQPEIGLQPEDFFGLRMQQYDPSMQDVNIPTTRDDDILGLAKQLYTPETEITDRYKKALLEEMPQREKPSKKRRLAGILAGMGGDPKVADYVTNKPYYQKLEDWKVKEKALGEGASQERLRNVNERQLTTDLAKSQIQEKGLTARTQNQLSRLEFDKQKSDQIYEIKVRDLERKANDAENKLSFAEKALQQKGENFQTTMAYRDAQLAAMNARHALDIAQKEKALDEQKHLHSVMETKWKQEDEDRNTRLSQYEKQLGINQQRVDQGPGGNKIVTTETKDAKGVITGSKTVKTEAGKTQKLQKEIPGIPGSLAESSDGGKTWHRVK